MKVLKATAGALMFSAILFSCKGKDSTADKQIIILDTSNGKAITISGDTARIVNTTTTTTPAAVAPVSVPAPAPAPAPTKVIVQQVPAPATASTGASSGGNGTTTTTTQTQQKKGISKAAKGAIIGGVGGAVTGAVISKDAKGAAIGGAVGAAGGYIIGRKKDKKDGRVQ